MIPTSIIINIFLIHIIGLFSICMKDVYNMYICFASLGSEKQSNEKLAIIFVITVIPILIIVASIFYITVISSITVINWDSAAFGSVRFTSVR